jgi:hypothetical protein
MPNRESRRNRRFLCALAVRVLRDVELLGGEVDPRAYELIRMARHHTVQPMRVPELLFAYEEARALFHHRGNNYTHYALLKATLFHEANHKGILNYVGYVLHGRRESPYAQLWIAWVRAQAPRLGIAVPYITDGG